MPKAKLDQGKMLFPGDEGANNPSVPWGWVRNALGWRKPKNIRLEVHGFFLIDRRRSPPVAIFKNCEVQMSDGVRPVLLQEPMPFSYLGEALYHRDRMHLSSDDEKRITPAALCPDEGLGEPYPDIMAIDRREAKER